MTHEPFTRAGEWLDAAKADNRIADHTAMALATTSPDGQPSVRMVLLKGFDARGFVFYTNFNSRKADDLLSNPKAALCFHWVPLERQLRVEGQVEEVSDEEADAYFASRARISQLGAWASLQSQIMPAHDALATAMQETEARFAGQDVPRPPHWSGFRLVPEVIEFWQQGAFRLHERELYERVGTNWRVSRLYP